jgi:hypothetical protein
MRRSLTALVAVLALSTLLMLPAFDAPAPPLDEGELVAFPARVLDGAVPQRDFYDPYGPGSVWTIAAADEILGESLTTERVVGMIYRLCIVAAAFALALNWGLGAALVAATAIAATLVGSVGAPASIGFWALALLGYAALARVVLAPKRGSPGGARVLVPAAGVLLGASALMRGDFLPAVVIAAAPLVLVLPARERRRFAAGATVSLTPLLLHVALAGPHAVWRSLKIGLGARVHPARPPFVSDLAEIVALYALATLALLVAGTLLERRARRDPEARALIGAGLWGIAMVPFALGKLDEGHVIVSAIAVLAALPAAALVLIRSDPLQRPTGRAARRFALTGVAVVLFFACAEAIRVPLYHQADELVTGSRPASFEVTNKGRSFRLSDPVQAQQAKAILTDVDRLARPGDSVFVGPQDLRTAGTNGVFLYFLLPQLKPASYYLVVDRHTINRPSNGFARELPNASFLILEANRPATSPAELGPPTANEIVANRFCVRDESGPYRLYERCDLGHLRRG